MRACRSFRSFAVLLAGLSSLPALASLLGCAETQFPPSQPAVVFPSRAEIAQIPARPPRAEAFGTGDVAVDEWRVESPPLPSDGPYDDASPWASLLQSLVKTRGESVSLSPALRCAAAEVARFHGKNHALPVERLRRFVLARCGSDAPNFIPFVWFADAPSRAGGVAGVSDEQVAARAREALANASEEALAHGHHRVGLAAARSGGHVSVVLAIADDEARLEPGPRSVDAQRRVALRGTARGEYARISALVNRGDYGVSPCDRDLNVQPPHFAFTCELAPGDSYDWVEVLGEKRGHVLSHALSDVMIYEGDASAVRYTTKAHGPPSLVTTAPAFARSLVERLNGIRQTAKAEPLTLDVRQSAENERLAGTILDGALTHDDDAADKAAIGLMAGWNVDAEMIRAGQFFLGVVAPARDVDAWLDTALDRPIGRLALLDPAARRIAVGPSFPASVSGLGAAVTTYALFESDDHAADEALFFQRIQQARAAHGLVAAQRLPASDEVRHRAMQVRHDETTPQGALNEMLASQSWMTEAPAYGYVLETNDVAHVDIPDVFLQKGPLPLVVAITHHRAPGAAWGQYVIFTLLPAGLPQPRAVEANTRAPERRM